MSEELKPCCHFSKTKCLCCMAEPIGNSDELPEWITSYCNERILDLEEWRAEQNHEDLELRERAYYMIKAFKEILSLRKPEAHS